MFIICYAEILTNNNNMQTHLIECRCSTTT